MFTLLTEELRHGGQAAFDLASDAQVSHRLRLRVFERSRLVVPNRTSIISHLCFRPRRSFEERPAPKKVVCVSALPAQTFGQIAQTYGTAHDYTRSYTACRGPHIFSCGTRGINELAVLGTRLFSRLARIFFRARHAVHRRRFPLVVPQLRYISITDLLNRPRSLLHTFALRRLHSVQRPQSRHDRSHYLHR